MNKTQLNILYNAFLAGRQTADIPDDINKSLASKLSSARYGAALDLTSDERTWALGCFEVAAEIGKVQRARVNNDHWQAIRAALA